MPDAGVDSLLVYGFTAMIAHFLMSLGQTLFHRYLGHTRFGGRFFTNHIQFHHTHYSGDHVVSTDYLDNGDNNTLFFLMPVAVIVSLSYLFLRLDFLAIQLAAMSLSFCGHYYIDNQYHVAGSWLGRFSWFRRKQQLHFIHHRHGNCNFAVIDFFWDRLLGTYRHVEERHYDCSAPPRRSPRSKDSPVSPGLDHSASVSTLRSQGVEGLRLVDRAGVRRYQRDWEFADSSMEESGFELAVPPRTE